MDGLLSLLVFAGLFYLMMRFGCGAHMTHGHGGKNEESGAKQKHIDPVCGKDVETSEGYGKMYKDRLYRFCSKSCLNKFDENPNLYLNK